jgi:hypothetical protein
LVGAYQFQRRGTSSAFSVAISVPAAVFANLCGAARAARRPRGPQPILWRPDCCVHATWPQRRDAGMAASIRFHSGQGFGPHSSCCSPIVCAIGLSDLVPFSQVYTSPSRLTSPWRAASGAFVRPFLAPNAVFPAHSIADVAIRNRAPTTKRGEFRPPAAHTARRQ